MAIEERIPKTIGGAPTWAVGPVLLAAVFLIDAVFGLFYDVAYHVNHGRDVFLFTPAHVMILVGLLGVGVIAVATVALATLQDAPTPWRVRGLRIPYAALPLYLLAGAALIGFPIDDLWHQTFGIDVTLWSPTHLVMIGGAVLTTFVLPLLARQAGGLQGRGAVLAIRRISLAGALPLGLSVFLLEFDYGVPQWQAIYHPLLLALLSGLGLVAAREILGRGGALKAAAFFLVMRVLLGLFVLALGYGFTPFPLLLGSALCVEGVYLLEGRLRPLPLAALAGLAVGTLGLAVEWAWTQPWYPFPWQASLLPRMWLPLLAAVLGAVVGAAYGRVVAGRPAGIAAAVTGLALVGLAVLLAIPLPRQGASVQAQMQTAPVSGWRMTVDRYGRPAAVRDISLSLQVSPATAADGADWFDVVSWQGGGRTVVRLRETSPGHYASTGPIPTGGSWKSMVYLAKGDQLAALPIYFPPDPEYGNPGHAVQPSSSARFVPAGDILMSEAHSGAGWVAVLGYALLLGAAFVWVLSIVLAAARLSSQGAATSAVSRKTSKARFSSRPA